MQTNQIDLPHSFRTRFRAVKADIQSGWLLSIWLVVDDVTQFCSEALRACSSRLKSYDLPLAPTLATTPLHVHQHDTPGLNRSACVCSAAKTCANSCTNLSARGVFSLTSGFLREIWISYPWAHGPSDLISWLISQWLLVTQLKWKIKMNPSTSWKCLDKLIHPSVLKGVGRFNFKEMTAVQVSSWTEWFL